MTTTAADLCRQFEGCRLTAYQDAVGVWTIGWGHTGPEVVHGLVWTQQQADAALDEDVAKAAYAVRRLCPTLAVGSPRYEAIVDWTYNLGAGALEHSTLRVYIGTGQWSLVPNEIRRWCHAGGKVLPGLVRRRNAEAQLWETDDEGSPAEEGLPMGGGMGDVH